MGLPHFGGAQGCSKGRAVAGRSESLILDVTWPHLTAPDRTRPAPGPPSRTQLHLARTQPHPARTRCYGTTTTCPADGALVPHAFAATTLKL